MTHQEKEPSISVVGWPAFPKRELNPYPRLLYTAIRDLGVEVRDCGNGEWRTLDADLVHIHWPENTLGHKGMLLAARDSLARLWMFRILRRRGVRVVWTAHNMEQHEGKHAALARLYWKVFPRLIDGIISLNEGDVEPLTRMVGRRKVPIAVIPHGHYRGAYPDTISPAEARRSLGLEEDASVIAWVGAIREYKNVDGLVTAFREVGEDGWRLLVAGKAIEGQLHERLTQSAKLDSRLQYYAGWVAAQDMQRYLKAADVVVLPYHKIWNSGAALLALSFNVPVVLPRSPSMLELRGRLGEEWVYLYDGALSGDILIDCFDWLRRQRRSRTADLGEFAWERIAARTVALYRQVLAS